MCSRKKRTKKGAANESLPKGVAQEVPECTEAYAGGPTDSARRHFAITALRAAINHHFRSSGERHAKRIVDHARP